MTRDPRIDPKPGDVLRSNEWFVEVINREYDDMVDYAYFSIAVSGRQRVHISRWCLLTRDLAVIVGTEGGR